MRHLLASWGRLKVLGNQLTEREEHSLAIVLGNNLPELA
jgi:hypothetical protein